MNDLRNLSRDQLLDLQQQVQQALEKYDEAQINHSANEMLHRLPSFFQIHPERYVIYGDIKSDISEARTRVTFEFSDVIRCMAYDVSHIAYSIEDALKWWNDLELHKHTVQFTMYTAHTWEETDMEDWLLSLKRFVPHLHYDAATEVIKHEKT